MKVKRSISDCSCSGMQIGKYELGRTLGEGSFGKVKFAWDRHTGQAYAVKILEKSKIFYLKISDQVKREIGTLKLLRHPNIARLHEVLASKTKIYMVLEYVNGGDLFETITEKGKLSEVEGRKLFQQLIDGVSYCHEKGVCHRDLKLDNILIDSKGNIKVSDFGLSALPQHFRDDGLLHTTCGTPNYISPEILADKGYNGAASDIWSCGVILYSILVGHLPFDDRSLAVVYQKIMKGNAQIPNWISPEAKNLIKRILEPNPSKRITMAEIKADDWFREGYTPSMPEDEEENVDINEDFFSVNEVHYDSDRGPESPPALVNAFQLISMSSFLDLSGFFEKENVYERKIRFTSNLSHKELLERIDEIVTGMGFCVQRKNGKLKVRQEQQGQMSSSLSCTAEVFEISPSLYVVELRKSYGDASVYKQMCRKLSNDLGVPPSEKLLGQELLGPSMPKVC